MEAKEKSLIKYLEGTDQEFVIPVFQRRYDWRAEHCRRLWQDLENVIQANFRSHFFGSIVSVVNHSPSRTEFLIIDGQQRITTVSLLMAAICNLVRSGELKDPNKLTVKIFDEYLINRFETDEDKTRLKLIDKDHEIFSRIVRNDLDEIPEQTNIFFRYDFFVSQLRQTRDRFTVEQIFQAIRNLFIVDIQLKQGEDDPQLIFESLNSTGLALSEADKIRNLVLMNLSHSLMSTYFTKYWQKIENNTALSKNGVSDFVRDYLTIKLRRIPRADRVYLEFKDYFSQTTGAEDVLSELLTYSRYYKNILTATFTDVLVSKALVALKKLENRVTYPFLMELFDIQQHGIINVDDLTKVLHAIEAYLFRRTICRFLQMR